MAVKTAPTEAAFWCHLRSRSCHPVGWALAHRFLVLPTNHLSGSISGGLKPILRC
ncbi:hypothetical protein Pstu14405_02525 [Stutzerimonas stutzeri]|nr:hypothetical protein Pstu14405_02525 [Stutzerimonas stutzeri]